MEPRNQSWNPLEREEDVLAFARIPLLILGKMVSDYFIPLYNLSHSIALKSASNYLAENSRCFEATSCNLPNYKHLTATFPAYPSSCDKS